MYTFEDVTAIKNIEMKRTELILEPHQLMDFMKEHQHILGLARNYLMFDGYITEIEKLRNETGLH